MEALISINNQLRQPEAAIGILTMAQQTLHMELKVRCTSRTGGLVSVHTKEPQHNAGATLQIFDLHHSIQHQVWLRLESAKSSHFLHPTSCS